MYALLHSANPQDEARFGGDADLRVVMDAHRMSDDAPDVYLHARFTDLNTITVTTDVRFVASKNAAPAFATVWEGPNLKAVVPVSVERGGNVVRGDIVTVALTWRMADL